MLAIPKIILYFLLSQLLNADNPYNIEFLVDESNLDVTNGVPIKMDTIVINSDVVRAMKMLYDTEPGWGEEYRETVDEYFHTQNLTNSVRAMLGMNLV